MQAPFDNAAYLAQLCAGAETVQQAKKESYLLATGVFAALLVGGLFILHYWENGEPARLTAQKENKTA